MLSSILHNLSLRGFMRKYQIEILLAFLVLVSYSYFYNGATGNQISRLNTIFAFVEPGTADYLTFEINRFLPDPINGENTIDWARFGDNYYSK